MSVTDFAKFAGEFGIAWAFVIALAIAYWLEVQDRKKNSVPKDLYNKVEDKIDQLLTNQNSMASALETIAQLVKVAIFGRGSS